MSCTKYVLSRHICVWSSNFSESQQFDCIQPPPPTLLKCSLKKKKASKTPINLNKLIKPSKKPKSLKQSKIKQKQNKTKTAPKQIIHFQPLNCSLKMENFKAGIHHIGISGTFVLPLFIPFEDCDSLPCKSIYF